MPRSKLPFATPELKQALTHLGKDKYLAPLVKHLPPPSSGGKKDPFDALIVALLNQSISLKVARVFEERLRKLAGRPFTPESIAKVPAKKFRGIGVATSKVVCAKACAAYAAKHGFTAKSCSRLSDAEVTDIVVSIKGAGPWTATMVLLFGLGRLDVMPDGDGGIQRGAQKLFRSKSLATAHKRLLREAPHWQPYRSIAAWYLWAYLDN